MGAPKRVRIDPTDDWQLLRPYAARRPRGTSDIHPRLLP
jgi:hypothetical protein